VEDFGNIDMRPEVPLSRSGAAFVAVLGRQGKVAAVNFAVELNANFARSATGHATFVEVDRGIDLENVYRGFKLDEFVLAIG
jgi:hypothetical protein